jgi:FkbM family methyltransferase
MSLFNTIKFVVNHPLNRHRKARALIGFIKWQIGSRLIPGKVVYNWVNGSKFIVSTGETGLTGNIYCGLDEFEDMSYVLHILSSEDLFIDIGANVGSYTILACAAKGASGYCFEPVPTTFERLMDNIKINNLSGHVKPLSYCLSDKEGELFFTSNENSVNHVVAQNEQSAEVIRVQVLPLDNILKGLSPTMLKIDVEGFETPVIAGAKATLNNKSLHSVIIELNGSGLRYGFDEEEIINTMKNYGFSTYAYDPFLRELKSLEGKNSLSDNTLFIRNIELVREKLKNATKVLVNGIRL